jgi:hypothetical protein
MTDAMLNSGSATKNYGSSTSIDVDGSPDKAALLRWDLSSVPADASVESASITLRLSSGTNHEYEIYELLQSWNEAQTTWSQSASGSSWGAAGAQQGGIDRGTTVLGTITSSSTGFVTIALNSAGIAVVQNWITDPTSNHGFVIQDYANSTSDGFTMSSSEHSTVSYRPRLTVAYRSAESAPIAGDPEMGSTAPEFGPIATAARTEVLQFERHVSQEKSVASENEMDSVQQYILNALLERVSQRVESGTAASVGRSHRSADGPGLNLDQSHKPAAIPRSAAGVIDADALDSVFREFSLQSALANIGESR